MRKLIVAATILSLAILSGCASMSKDECLIADWQTIGYEDGAVGRNVAFIGERRKACAKHGVAPDKTAYDAGYEQGILSFCNFGRGRDAALGGHTTSQLCPSHADYFEGYADGLNNFCTYDSGYEYGLSGRSYRRTCPVDLEITFLDGYNTGSYIHSLRSELYALESDLAGIDAHRDDIKTAQNELKQALILNRELTAEERAQMLLDIDALRDEDDELEAQKDSLLIQIGDVQGQLRDLGVDI